ncbi:hypothetical protein PU629_03905 [Pullulanibacillus sp. KACC 23026]|uniref:hypothetical protein n=1 Tax=Pullulanibacillus sp. KACC 23026 TaxID=3028315 RepID=UPI0023B0994E|nr:hypothetical protein [Pullulanibacillus sp. KACC 23026]WEG13521.1 hypothetical protein PU629_03905 [Pullulanibacillus sp. KACC 23026]
MAQVPIPAQFNINIHIIKVNSFENASAINVGNNLLAEWQNSDKKTMGIGQNMGDDAAFLGTKSMVDDRDYMDSPASFDSEMLIPGLKP